MRVLLFILLFSNLSFSQDSLRVTFGKVTKEALSEASHPLEKDASAAVIYQYQKVYFYTFFNRIELVTEYFQRLKIYKKEGFDYATKKIPLKKYSGVSENITSVKGVTMFLENDSIVSSELKFENLFKEHVTANIDLFSLTFPNVKEGVILDLSFTIRSPMPFVINDIEHQFDIPIDRFEADVIIPESYVFRAFTKGFKKIHYNVYNKKGSQFYEITALNTPSLKDEGFVNNIENYRSATVFDIVETKSPLPKMKFSKTWEDLVKTLYKSDYFSDEIKKTSYFSSDLKKLMENDLDSLSRVYQIFDFVKSEIKWNGKNSSGTIDGLSKAYKNKLGNAGEVNMILTAMLRKAGFDSNPVLLSTRKNGVPVFPSLSGFNYVISAVTVGGKELLLDATDKFLPPGMLNEVALNWNGKLIRKDGTYKEINLFPDEPSVKSTKLVGEMDESGNFKGTIEKQTDRYIAHSLRILTDAMQHGDYIPMIESALKADIDNYKNENLEQVDLPFKESFEFFTDNPSDIIDGKIYFNPMLFYAREEIPFVADKREFPIDFSFPFNESYTIDVKLPAGYRIDFTPKNVTYILPDGLGKYEFKIVVTENSIRLTTDMEINSAIVAASYYSIFKDFFKKVYLKENEKVIISKDKT